MTDRPSAMSANLATLRARRGAVNVDNAGSVPELCLADLLDDPLTRQVMASDHIDIRDLSQLMIRIRGQMAARALSEAMDERAGRQRRP